MAKIISAAEAAAMIPSGSTVMFGGYIGNGAAYSVIDEMVKCGVRDITGIMNDPSMLDGPDGGECFAWAKLVRSGQMTGYIGSHLGTNPEAEKMWAEGRFRATLIPQGSLAEMIRAGGYGLGGVITPTGVGTTVEESPLTDRKINVDGRDYLLMKPLRADFALLCGYKVDRAGNVWYKGTTKNFSTVMAMAADTVIVEAVNLVETGDIEPENVATPGVVVDYIVQRGEA